MSQTINPMALPSGIQKKMQSIRLRQASLALVRALAIGVSALMIAMVVAMMLDWSLTLFSTGARLALTTTSLLLGMVALIGSAIPSLAKSLSTIQSALDADHSVPQLEERWTTVTSLAASESLPTSSVAQAMLQQVTSEAMAMERLVEPKRVTSLRLRQPAYLLGSSTLVLAAFLILGWPQTYVLFQRFWSPTANITATRLVCSTGDTIVPRGESLDLTAELSGLPRDKTILTIEHDSGIVDVFDIQADAERPNIFKYSMRVANSLRYRMRAGDAQTPWHEITAIDYPTLAEVRMTIRAPGYVDREPYQKTFLPSRVKVVEGSRMELKMKPAVNLERFDIVLMFEEEAEEQVVALRSDSNGWYRFNARLLKDMTLRPVFSSTQGLDNQDRRICRIQVVPDKAPIARIASPTEEMAVALDEVIDITFEAHDDYGIETAELVVYDGAELEEGKEPKLLALQDIPLGNQKLQQHVMGNTQLDVQQLNLPEGANISYAIRVTDNRRTEADEQVLDKMAPPNEEPPGEEPPGEEPPGEDPPGEDPSGEDPPGEDPSGEDPSDPSHPSDSSDPSDPSDSSDPSDPSDSREPNPSTDPLATANVAMNSQRGESGQDTETNRQRLKITRRLTGVAASTQRRSENLQIRDRVVVIDNMLERVESRLLRLVERTLPDSERGSQFQEVDTRLGDIESYIGELRKETKEGQFAFVGLQMVDIGRSHVTPARDRIFVAMREPASSNRVSTEALQQVVRARELLSALLQQYDRVIQDRELAEKLDDNIEMYEVYVEEMQQLMRERQQTTHPLQRKMGIIEVDQDYLDRFAEVLTLRREMMREFGRMLADDPRLLARYIDLVKRRQRSLRDRLSELAERQDEVSMELSGWRMADETQREDVWTIVAEMRLHAATPLARDTAELSERIEKQMPLVLNSDEGTGARIIQQAQEITRLSREIAFEADSRIQNRADSESVSDLTTKAAKLLEDLRELDALLNRLDFENNSDDEVVQYVNGRLVENRTVADHAEAWAEFAHAIQTRQYHRLAAVDQQRIAVETELLRVEMLDFQSNVEGQFEQQGGSEVPAEIIDTIQELHRVMETIALQQTAAEYALSRQELDSAELQQAKVREGFERAERLFDDLRRAIVAALDEYELSDPNIADLQDPTLDEFLAQLEREPNIESQLGIPNRPRNLRVIADSLVWQQDGEDGIGQSSEAAMARAREAMKRKQQRKQPQGELTEEQRAKLARQKEMQEMLVKSLSSVEQKLEDPDTPEEQRRQLEQVADDVRRMVDQDEETAAEQWERLVQSDQAKEIFRALARGEEIPDEQWNKLVSTLEDGLWQVRGKTPPEQYRKAIEQYQDQIRQLIDVGDTP